MEDQVVPQWNPNTKDNEVSDKDIEIELIFLQHQGSVKLAKKRKISVVRNVYFIRHGRYNKNDRNGDLTPLGQQQASKTGLALVQSLQRHIYIFSLDILRAKQTTEILQTTIPGTIIKYE